MEPSWKIHQAVIFIMSLILMLGVWIMLFWAESLFTESHLVGYYCCVTELDLPAIGTLERMVSDFFHGVPGKHLPSLLFVGVQFGLYWNNKSWGRRKRWLIPLLFVAFGLLYLLLDFGLIMPLSRSISNKLVGPSKSVYTGINYTWYGIVAHLLLWGVFIIGQYKILSTLRTKSRI